MSEYLCLDCREEFTDEKVLIRITRNRITGQEIKATLICPYCKSENLEVEEDENDSHIYKTS